MAKPIRTQDVAAFVDAFNRAVAGTKIKRCLLINPTRTRNIKTALVEGTLDQWKAAFAALAAWPYARGQNDNGWRAGIDYILRPAHRARWLEEGLELEDRARLDAARRREEQDEAAVLAQKILKAQEERQRPVERHPCSDCGKQILVGLPTCFACERKRKK